MSKKPKKTGLTEQEQKHGFAETPEGIVRRMDKSNRIIRMTAPDGAVTYKRQKYGRWAWDKKKTTDLGWHPYSGIFYLTPAQAVANAVSEKEEVKIVASDPIK